MELNFFFHKQFFWLKIEISTHIAFRLKTRYVWWNFLLGLKTLNPNLRQLKGWIMVFQEFFQGEDFNSTTKVLQFHEINIWHYWTFFELIKSELYQHDLSTIAWSNWFEFGFTNGPNFGFKRCIFHNSPIGGPFYILS